jgi:GT2 family glycosyltransferase
VKAPVSIVIPCRDRAGELAVLLASLAGLEPAPLEVIVVDDGSAQPLSAPGARVLRNERPVGPAAAKNQGAAAAGGEFLLFMDSDTEAVDPGLLGRLTALFQARSDCGIAGGEFILRDGEWRVALRSFDAAGAVQTRLLPAPVAATSGVSHISSSNLMIRASVFSELGGYWEPYRYIMEDVDLCVLARARGWKVYTGSELAVRHYRTPTARSTSHVRTMHLRNQALFWVCWGRSGRALRALARGLAPRLLSAAVSAAVSAAAAYPAAARRRRSLGGLTEGAWA